LKPDGFSTQSPRFRWGRCTQHLPQFGRYNVLNHQHCMSFFDECKDPESTWNPFYLEKLGQTSWHILISVILCKSEEHLSSFTLQIKTFTHSGMQFLVSFSWLEESLAQGKLLPPNAYRVFSSSRSVSGTRSPSRSRSASPDTAQSRGGSLLESPRPSATPPAPKTPAGSGQKRLREAEESAHEKAEGLADEVAEDNKKLGLVPGGGAKESRAQSKGDGGHEGGRGAQRNNRSFEEWGEVGRDVAAEKQDVGVVSLGRTAEAIGREIVEFGGGAVEAQPAHSGGGSEEEREISSRLAKRRKGDEGDSGAGPSVNTEMGLVAVNEEGFLDLRENQTPAGMANPDLNRPLLKVLGELKDLYRDGELD
jgi:hypothetical protein